MISAGPSWREPDRGIPARQHIHMGTKIRYEEAVDYIFRGKQKLDRPAGWHVQLINLTLSFGMLEFPHPLLANDVNYRGIIGRAVRIEVDDCSPAKHEKEDDQWRKGPNQFKPMI